MTMRNLWISENRSTSNGEAILMGELQQIQDVVPVP